MPRCCPTVPGDSLGDSSYTVGLKSPEGGQGAPSPRPALGGQRLARLSPSRGKVSAMKSRGQLSEQRFLMWQPLLPQLTLILSWTGLKCNKAGSPAPQQGSPWGSGRRLLRRDDRTTQGRQAGRGPRATRRSPGVSFRGSHRAARPSSVRAAAAATQTWEQRPAPPPRVALAHPPGPGPGLPGGRPRSTSGPSRKSQRRGAQRAQPRSSGAPASVTHVFFKLWNAHAATSPTSANLFSRQSFRQYCKRTPHTSVLSWGRHLRGPNDGPKLLERGQGQ